MSLNGSSTLTLPLGDAALLPRLAAQQHRQYRCHDAGHDAGADVGGTVRDFIMKVCFIGNCEVEVCSFNWRVCVHQTARYCGRALRSPRRSGGQADPLHAGVGQISSVRSAPRRLAPVMLATSQIGPARSAPLGWPGQVGPGQVADRSLQEVAPLNSASMTWPLQVAPHPAGRTQSSLRSTPHC